MLKRAFWVLRWWVSEFCAIPAPLNLVAGLTALCRLAGCSVLLALIRLAPDAAVARDLPMAAVRGALLVLLAILLGNLAKELAFVICADIANWCGQSFLRTGFTLDGRQVCEIRFPNGTWVRYESGRGTSVCEWTEVSGACKRITLGPGGRRAESASHAVAAVRVWLN